MTLKLTQQIDYWINGSKKAFGVAQSLFEKKHYPESLFFCHLAVEKLLKAAVVKTTQAVAPYTHDLRRLALIAGLELTTEQRKTLDTLSTFNISARYPDEQEQFAKRYGNKKTATTYLNNTNSLLLWLKKEFRNR